MDIHIRMVLKKSGDFFNIRIVLKKVGDVFEY